MELAALTLADASCLYCGDEAGGRGSPQQAEERQGNTERGIFPSPSACLPPPRLQRATQARSVSRAEPELTSTTYEGVTTPSSCSLHGGVHKKVKILI